MNGLILDVIVVVVAVLLIVFGAWRGMYKLIYGFVSSILALVLAIVLASTITTVVINKTSLDEMLYGALDEKIQGVLPKEMDASNVDITIEADGTVKISHGADEFATISDYMKSTPYAALGKIFDPILKDKNMVSMINPMVGTEGAEAKSTTLAKLCSTAAVAYILLAAVFIILWILSYLVMRLIMLLIKKLVTATFIGHALDKILGIVLGAAIAMLLIWGTFAIIRLLGTYTWIIPVNKVIETSTISKFLYEHNFLYDFLVKSTNLQGAIAGLIGKFSTGGQAVTPETPEKVENAARFVGKLISSGRM